MAFSNKRQRNLKHYLHFLNMVPVPPLLHHLGCLFNLQPALPGGELLYHSTVLPALLLASAFFVFCSLPVHNSGAYCFSNEQDNGQTLIDYSLAMTRIEVMLSLGQTYWFILFFYTLNLQL